MFRKTGRGLGASARARIVLVAPPGATIVHPLTRGQPAPEGRPVGPPPPPDPPAAVPSRPIGLAALCRHTVLLALQYFLEDSLALGPALVEERQDRSPSPAGQSGPPEPAPVP